jgi:hypothetical protein
MRVLHLPLNIASIPSHTVRGLRHYDVDARGLIFSADRVQTVDGLRLVRADSANGVTRKLQKTRWLAAFLWEVSRADVLHWYFGAIILPKALDLALVRMLRKPAIVEWMGSEIRIPDLEFTENSYYKEAFSRGYEYASLESLTGSRRLQAAFSESGFACAADLGMLPYIQRDIFPQVHILRRRLVVADYEPSFPILNNDLPLIVHSPTAPVTKGTAVVLAAIEQLSKRARFDFRLIQGIPRDRALEIIQNCDVFLDQFVLGDYGMAAIEAMAFGKPVVCYVKPSLERAYGPDLPIVNATQESVTDVLADLLADGARRHEVGLRSRAYVERHHDAIKIAGEMKSIYEDLLQRRGTRGTQ